MKKPLINSDLFQRGVETIITAAELSSLFVAGRSLRIKHGIDATSPDLHIGHATVLWKLRALQEAGHKAVILLGDTTTQIGDPTGKSKTRPVLSPSAIQKNIRSIEKQIRDILLTDKKVFELRKNSEWYGRMKTPEFLRLLSLVTHARLVERDMFQERVRKHSEIFMHELLYPVLQGYDSVMLRSDFTIIGSDQLFNEHMGRFLQEKFGQRPQVIVALKLLPGLDGREKMSKSLGNHIGLLDSPKDKFGKTMSIPDSLIVPYFEAYTDVLLDEVRHIASSLDRGENPMQAKLVLAEAVVRRYHGNVVARRAREEFLSLFSRREKSAISAVRLPHGTYDLAGFLVRSGAVASKSEARRLIRGRAVEIDGVIVADLHEKVRISRGTTFRVGKKKFFRIQ